MFRNYISEQGLTGLEPPPHCDAPGTGRRCTVEQVIGVENVWIRQVDPTGHKYNITRCKRTGPGWCNQTGNAHGGGIYTDNGSGGWDVSENVLAGVYHWMFTWQPGRMVDMRVRLPALPKEYLKYMIRSQRTKPRSLTCVLCAGPHDMPSAVSAQLG